MSGPFRRVVLPGLAFALLTLNLHPRFSSSPGAAEEMSSLIWALIKDNNSFIKKRGGVIFTTEPGNVTNKHSFKFSGLANKKAVSVIVGKTKKGSQVKLVTKAYVPAPQRTVAPSVLPPGSSPGASATHAARPGIANPPPLTLPIPPLPAPRPHPHHSSGANSAKKMFNKTILAKPAKAGKTIKAATKKSFYRGDLAKAAVARFAALNKALTKKQNAVTLAKKAAAAKK